MNEIEVISKKYFFFFFFICNSITLYNSLEMEGIKKHEEEEEANVHVYSRVRIQLINTEKFIIEIFLE